MKTKKNSKSVSELKSRTAQQGEEKQPLIPIDLAARQYNRGLPTPRLLKLLREKAPQFWDLAEVVGKWVWVRFDGKQPQKVTAALSELGFHWNNRRQVWQHPCGNFIRRDDFDPRRRYRSYFPADHQAA